MESLFDAAVAARTVERIRSVSPTSPRLWGKLDAPGMFAHCRRGLEMALRDEGMKWSLAGRLLSWTVKRKLVGSDAPFMRNSPTDPRLIQSSPSSLEEERAKLIEAVEAFAARGPAGMPKGPHPFFGRLTPEEWGRLMSKHLDHHLAQFSA